MVCSVFYSQSLTSSPHSSVGWVADMHPPSRQDYVSITLAGQGSGIYNNSKQWRRQSCWRVNLRTLLLFFLCGLFY
uniref:Uncharacterized protein n=1 Tax=Sphaeramia orbicularis TaxID=375764 RepID=A0A672Z792_9TELE